MSRSSNKTRARARAGRRAKWNSKKPRHERRAVGRPGRDGGTFTAVPTPFGFPAMIGAVSDATFADHQTYLGAHSLLPSFPPGAGPAPEDVARAFALLAAPDAPRESQLWAIVVLGHTPQREALEVLQLLGRSPDPYAGVARLAADECAEWMRFAADAEDTLSEEAMVEASEAAATGWEHSRHTRAELLN
jgi:hypothetical protein